METSRTLLRILVLVGCLPLVIRRANVVTAGQFDQSCTNYAGQVTHPNCPSGCTSGTHTLYTLSGRGFYNATQNTTPCSPSTCSQPVAYNTPTEASCKNAPCCLPNLTSPCSDSECFGGDP